MKLRIVFILALLLMFLPSVLADISSSSYTVGSTHIGDTGAVGASLSYSTRETLTYQQGTYQAFTSLSYQGDATWYAPPSEDVNFGAGPSGASKKEREEVPVVGEPKLIEKMSTQAKMAFLLIIIILIFLFGRKRKNVVAAGVNWRNYHAR